LRTVPETVIGGRGSAAGVCANAAADKLISDKAAAQDRIPCNRFREQFIAGILLTSGRLARLRRGYIHPRGDRKSAETLENRGDSGAPLRKRARNRMKIQGLQGCDRKQRGWRKRDRCDERVN
jgi:hypothetical protein